MTVFGRRVCKMVRGVRRGRLNMHLDTEMSDMLSTDLKIRFLRALGLFFCLYSTCNT